MQIGVWGISSFNRGIGYTVVGHHMGAAAPKMPSFHNFPQLCVTVYTWSTLGIITHDLYWINMLTRHFWFSMKVPVRQFAAFHPPQLSVRFEVCVHQCIFTAFGHENRGNFPGLHRLGFVFILLEASYMVCCMRSNPLPFYHLALNYK